MFRPERAALIEAITVWAKQHPHHDSIVLQVGNGVQLSPEQIVREIREETPTGELLLRVAASGAERFGLEAVLDSFTKPAGKG